MNAQRFTELVEAYGAEPARWPATEREDALAYMKAHPRDADNLLAPARSLDTVLESGRLDTTDTSFLAARILKAAQESDGMELPANDVVGGPTRLPRRQPVWRSIAATFVITTGVGFAMGQTAAAKSARIAEAEALLSLTLENPYDSTDLWEDL
ncbi:MAG: hypothetical protein EX271_10790 [Acidimicrobiales bacterium]|nr:hypothetical protein [Hyphomonadaceae bacterium]RZV39110.1 MAG: hypothetical protein EX271_10790 [Acidimicrobiales bacterium]